MTDQWNTLATDEQLQRTTEALQKNGITPIVVENKEEAKKKVLEIIPQGAEVMTMTSITLDTVGILSEINESGKYDAVKPKLMKMDRATQGAEMQKLGAAPTYAVGSVHAVTEDGSVLIASNTGSQLAAYVYGAEHVIWVIGSQKIVKDIEAGKKRIYEYILPQESVRARKAYGLPEDWNSFVSKLLIVNREVNPKRITLIIVKESLGF